jgi:hypothetical protein
MLEPLFLLPLALSIGSALGAPIQITAPPFSIAFPGTYEVTANLTCVSGDKAITIDSSKAGSVVSDLEG